MTPVTFERGYGTPKIELPVGKQGTQILDGVKIEITSTKDGYTTQSKGEDPVQHSPEEPPIKFDGEIYAYSTQTLKPITRLEKIHQQLQHLLKRLPLKFDNPEP